MPSSLDIHVDLPVNAIWIGGVRYTPAEARLVMRQIHAAMDAIDEAAQARAWVEESKDIIDQARTWLAERGGGWIVRMKNDKGLGVTAAPYEGTRSSRVFLGGRSSFNPYDLSLDRDPRAGILVRFHRGRSLAVRGEDGGHACGQSGTGGQVRDCLLYPVPICTRCARMGPEAQKVRLSKFMQDRCIEEVPGTPESPSSEQTEG